MKWYLAAALGGILMGLLVVTSLKCGSSAGDIRIFYASGLTSLLDDYSKNSFPQWRYNALMEGSGSQAACRKLTELGRSCDLLMLADASLVSRMLPGYASFRLDFATDEIVLAVGSRAPHISEAEADWTSTLALPDVRLARVDENQAPIGYRTLLVWRLTDMTTHRQSSIYDALLAKAAPLVDDVGRLTPLLKRGEIDYAFIYKSTCVSEDIRFIKLADLVNLSSDHIDYGIAEVTFDRLKTGAKETVTMKGEPVYWTLTIPDASPNFPLAAAVVRRMLTDGRDKLSVHGFRPLAPRLYAIENAAGIRAKKEFGDIAQYGGELK
ncbi:MAG: substrate-binding domain-containing protein [Candidatus Brocadiia bacterium]